MSIHQPGKDSSSIHGADSTDPVVLSKQLSNMQRENEELLAHSQRLLLSVTGNPVANESTSYLKPSAQHAMTDASQGLSNEVADHHALAHSFAEQAAHHLLLQHRVQRGEAEVELMKQRLFKKQTTVARQQEELHQQLVKSQATLDDMSRTLHQQNQEITELRAKLQDRDTCLVDKTTLVTSLQDELSACISRFQMEKQQSAVELNDIRHAQIVERETINKKIDEVVRQVRDKEEELDTLVASMATHEVAMQAKDQFIKGLEEKLQACRAEMAHQSAEVVEQRQKFSGLQRDAEKGERQVFQLTSSLQQCQKQLELHMQDTKTTELLRAKHRREISQFKQRIAQLEDCLEQKSVDNRRLKSSQLELEASIAQLRHACSFAEQRQHDAEKSAALLKSDVSRVTAELELCKAEVGREKEQREEAKSLCLRLQSENRQLTDEMCQKLDTTGKKLAMALDEKSQLESNYEKLKEQIAQAKINHDRQWKAEVQLTERLTESNAELLKCRKDIQEKQEAVTHVELLLEEVKTELHTKDVQCSELKAIVEKQKQSMMQRASQVNDLVLSVQSAQGKQQDEVDSLHAALQDAQTQLQSSRSQCKLLAVELETARKAVTTAKEELQYESKRCESFSSTVAKLEPSLVDCKTELSKMKIEESDLRTEMTRLTALCEQKQADLLQSEVRRQAADRKSTEMENKLRDIHRRLMDSDTSKTTLSIELQKATELVKTGDEVNLSKVQLLEQQLSTLRESYQQQVETLRSKHAEVIVAQEERELAHRQEVASQIELLESLRKQEAEAQLTAAQCSAELVRVKKRLHWFQQEVVLKDAGMKEVDAKLTHLEQSLMQQNKCT